MTKFKLVRKLGYVVTTPSGKLQAPVTCRRYFKINGKYRKVESYSTLPVAVFCNFSKIQSSDCIIWKGGYTATKTGKPVFTITRKCKAKSFTKTQLIRIAFGVVLGTAHSGDVQRWGKNWINGEDRSKKSLDAILSRIPDKADARQYLVSRLIRKVILYPHTKDSLWCEVWELIRIRRKFEPVGLETILTWAVSRQPFKLVYGAS